jgi:hypothetical protein
LKALLAAISHRLIWQSRIFVAPSFGITQAQWEKLLENGRAAALNDDFDPLPVVTLRLPDGRPMFCVGQLNPDDRDTAFGVLLIIYRRPMLRFISLEELAADPMGKLLQADACDFPQGLTFLTYFAYASGNLQC